MLTLVYSADRPVKTITEPSSFWKTFGEEVKTATCKKMLDDHRATN